MRCPTSIIQEDSYIIVDIETTGFSVEHCNIIEIGALKIVDGEVEDSFHTFVRQDCSIPQFITDLTGITDEDVAGGIPINSAMKEFAGFAGDLVLVGHNVSFDYRFLNHNSEKHLNVPLCNEHIDTVRLARGLVINIPNYKLGTLLDYFQIADIGQHRAINDTRMTYELIRRLSFLNDNYRESNLEQVQRSIQCGNRFCSKRIAMKTKMKHVNSRLLECIFAEMNSRVTYALYPSCNVLVMNDSAHVRFLTQDAFDEVWEPWLIRAKQRFVNGSLEVYSEKQVCDLLDIRIHEKTSRRSRVHVSAKDIAATIDEFDDTHPLYQKQCVFTGTLDRYDRRTAMQYVANVGGICQDGITKATDFLIVGDSSFSASIMVGKSSKQKKAEEMISRGHGIRIISEGTFYQLLKDE